MSRIGQVLHGHARATVNGIGRLTLIDAHGIARSHPYLQPDGHGWPDNDRRFMAFSAAIAALTKVADPDVLHLNDWHTCAALGHLADAPPTMLTIHTLAYQGRTNPGWLKTLPHHVADFEQWGDCNPLLGGIRLADVVVAVSPHYAAEITTPHGGFGLDGPLRDKGDRLVGILNGIDTTEWDPQNDHHLPATVLVDRSRCQGRDPRQAAGRLRTRRRGWSAADHGDASRRSERRRSGVAA